MKLFYKFTFRKTNSKQSFDQANQIEPDRLVHAQEVRTMQGHADHCVLRVFVYHLSFFSVIRHVFNVKNDITLLGI